MLTKNGVINSMKVYIITREPFPNGMAATNRIKCYAKALINIGIKCEVIVFTRTEVYGKTPKNLVGKGTFEGIPFQYIGGTPLRDKNVFVRKIKDYQDRLKLVRFLAKKLKTDDIVLWYCGVFVSFVNTIIDIVHIKNAKFVRDVCELPYGTSEETIKSVKLRKKTLLKQFPKCDGFITISDALTNLVKKYQSSYAKVIKIPILVDFEKYDLPDYSKNSEIPYIFHSGTLYEQKDGILGMIEAFGIASQKLSYSIRFILTGKKESSPHFLEINSLIEKYQLEDKIIFTGYLSDDELKEYLSKASLVIINKYKTQQNEYCFSTKLGEYLSAGKPVIITKVGEAMNWLTDGESAYFVESEDVLLLAEKIIHAFTDTEERCKIADRGKIVCKNSFDYHGYGPKLLDFFYSISH